MLDVPFQGVPTFRSIELVERMLWDPGLSIGIVGTGVFDWNRVFGPYSTIGIEGI